MSVVELIGIAAVVVAGVLVGVIIIAVKLQQLFAAMDDVLGQ